MKQKMLTLLGLAVLFAFVTRDPNGAAALVSRLVELLGQLADALAVFATGVGGGGQ
jgi:hypothetical protein